jgi:protein-tyrosine kinase
MSKVAEAMRRVNANGCELPALEVTSRAPDREPSPPEKEQLDYSRIRVVPARTTDAATLFPSDSRSGQAATEYRIIRTKIAQVMKTPFLLAISSPAIGDGKTVTAVNLAIALAIKRQGRTLLIDADLRRSSIHKRLEIPAGPGLADILAGTCSFEKAVVQVEQFPSLYVLPAGEPASDPTELLDSSAWRELTIRVRSEFAHVILDCPPVDIVADYDLISPACDGVVVVVRPDRTDRSVCLSTLAKVRPKLIGVVMNASRRWPFWGRGTRDYSYYSNSHDGKRPQKDSA